MSRVALAQHQIEAVARCLELLAARSGAILADDVGLGKSYVAAAVAADAQRRGALIDLIVPAPLVMQWRWTLDDCDVEARLMTHDALVRDRFVPDASRERLVIVDEAHAFRNRRTQRYAALARRAVAARVLLVTATPLCNSVDDLESLIWLFAPDDLLADRGVPSIELAFRARDAGSIGLLVSELVIRRTREVLPPALQFGELERRVIRHAVPRVAFESLQFPIVDADPALLRRFLRRRLESSEAALLESLQRQRRFYERALECLAQGRTLRKRDYRSAFGAEEDRDAFQQILFWDLWAPPSVDVDPRAIQEELAQLDALSRFERSSKRELLVELVREMSEPLLVFTGFAATAHDLFDALRALRRCALVTSRERREHGEVFAAFQRGDIDLLVSTDLGAEGLNLQRAGAVVHYDLPWNPVRLDQRNGRAHRIGQTRPSVRAIYFLPRGDDTGVVETIAAKNRTRRRVLRAIESEVAIATALRPRLTRDAAAVRLLAAAEKKGLHLPERIERRHRAGVELLIAEMAREFLDQRRIDELVALL